MDYQKILAETYEENAKDLLVYQHEYEDEEVDYHEDNDYEVNDLPDKADFNKFQGDRNKPEHVIQPTSTDKQKNALKRDTDIRNIVLNIDSGFRGSIIPSPISPVPPEDFLNPGSSSSWFIFSTARIYRNITSVKLTSLEFPNTFYSFSALRENTSFRIDVTSGSEIGSYLITVPDGNYQNSAQYLTLNPATLVAAIQDYIDTTTTLTDFIIEYDPTTHRVQFTYEHGHFVITFPLSTSNPYKNGIGYNLGFSQLVYNSAQTVGGGLLDEKVTGEFPPDIIQDKYIYLAINDWNLIDHQDINQASFTAFAKIQLPGTKNTMIFDSNYINSSTKEYFFQQPVNIQRLEIKLLDAYGNVLETNGENWSMTIEMKQVNDSATYQALNQL